MKTDAIPQTGGLQMSPEQQAALHEMAAYSAAYAAAQAEGGAREAILAILHASEPPGVEAGRMHRMSFGLEYLLEASGNGRKVWLELLSREAGSDDPASAARIMETLFIFCDPDGALKALGLHNDLMAFRLAANRHARTVDEKTVASVTAWMVQEQLRYWNLLSFLEARAAAMEAAVPAKRDGLPPSLISSAGNTEAVCTGPSGDGAPTLSAHCGLPLSNDGAESIPAPDSPTELRPMPRAAGGLPTPVVPPEVRAKVQSVTQSGQMPLPPSLP